MIPGREQLHAMVDDLPDSALEHARIALEYCRDPGKHRMNIERAKQHAMRRSRQSLQDFAERIGHGLISGTGSGGGHTFADGNHHTSMVAFEDGKEATYHLYVFRGQTFEVVETIDFAADGQKIIREERITGGDGKEQLFRAEIPIRAS